MAEQMELQHTLLGGKKLALECRTVAPMAQGLRLYPIQKAEPLALQLQELMMELVETLQALDRAAMWLLQAF